MKDGFGEGRSQTKLTAQAADDRLEDICNT